MQDTYYKVITRTEQDICLFQPKTLSFLCCKLKKLPFHKVLKIGKFPITVAKNNDRTFIDRMESLQYISDNIDPLKPQLTLPKYTNDQPKYIEKTIKHLLEIKNKK
jgi:hypothetical protein